MSIQIEICEKTFMVPVIALRNMTTQWKMAKMPHHYFVHLLGDGASMRNLEE